jgi:hypothetical protein
MVLWTAERGKAGGRDERRGDAVYSGRDERKFWWQRIFCTLQESTKSREPNEWVLYPHRTEHTKCSQVAHIKLSVQHLCFTLKRFNCVAQTQRKEISQNCTPDYHRDKMKFSDDLLQPPEKELIPE